MKNTAPLKKKAIEATKNKKWQIAIEINQEIIEAEPNNINALNRLALALMQLDQRKEAKIALERVLKLDKHNKIASKNLKKLNSKKIGQIAEFNKETSYIEEPGKAKVMQLIRVTDKKTLRSLHVGQPCQLDPKKSLVSVNALEKNSSNKIYVGTLPSSISQRLIRLIKHGNKYQCTIHSVEPDENCCKVHIKELFVAKKNQGITSFPVNMEMEYEDPEMISLEREIIADTQMDTTGDEVEEVEDKQKEAKQIEEDNSTIIDTQQTDDDDDWDD